MGQNEMVRSCCERQVGDVKVGSWAVHIREELNNIGVGFVWQNRQAGFVETT